MVALQLALACASLMGAAGTAFCQGTISGVVTDHTGVAVPGAGVSYNNVPTLAGPHGGYVGPVVSGFVQTDATGRFSVSNLPYGNYYVCASGTQPTQLRSCDWDLPVGAAGLSAASPSANLTLALGQGARILMLLADPGGKVVDLLAYQIRGSSGGNLKIGATRGGWYVPATLVSNVNGVRTYQVVVPVGGTYQPTVWTSLSVAGNASGLGVTANTSPAGLVTVSSIAVGNSDVTYSIGTVQ